MTGLERDSSAASRALARGAVQALEADLETLARRSDTLVIALPVDATAAALERLTGVAGPELVIDVASVKAPLQRFTGRVPNYVGTHPMAGRERGGIDAAEGQLFEGATWAYATQPNPALAVRIRAFIAAMGARPLEIDALRHDAIVALTSHLPQALSVALGAELAGAMHTDPQVRELCGPGMMSMLRLARSPEAIWLPIISANAGPLGRQLRSIARALSAAADGLDAGDSAPLMSYFEAARCASGVLEERFSNTLRS